MGSAYCQEKFLKIAATQVYKVREKLYNEYDRGNKRETEKNYITESRKNFKKLVYFPDKVHIIYCKKKFKK